jgi:hypothetical protein
MDDAYVSSDYSSLTHPHQNNKSESAQFRLDIGLRDHGIIYGIVVDVPIGVGIDAQQWLASSHHIATPGGTDTPLADVVNPTDEYDVLPAQRNA